jgi:hypothetical protein
MARKMTFEEGMIQMASRTNDEFLLKMGELHARDRIVSDIYRERLARLRRRAARSDRVGQPALTKAERLALMSRKPGEVVYRDYRTSCSAVDSTRV